MWVFLFNFGAMEKIRKLGIIRISKELYEKDYKTFIHKLFEQFQPLEIKIELYPCPVYIVTATHEEFEEVEEGFIIPTYDVTIKLEDGDKFSISFNKIKI